MSIKKSNAHFVRMTPNQKRVAIARDALLQIRRGKYLPESGVYVDFANIIEPESNNTDLQKCLPKAGVCTVCARGALFLSAVRKFNKCKIGSIDPDAAQYGVDSFYLDEFETYEERFFSQDQASMIEAFFEGSSGFSLMSWADSNSLMKYYHDFAGSDERRLKEICKNIIRNNGKFVIPKKYYEQE